MIAVERSEKKRMRPYTRHIAGPEGLLLNCAELRPVMSATRVVFTSGPCHWGTLEVADFRSASRSHDSRSWPPGLCLPMARGEQREGV